MRMHTIPQNVTAYEDKIVGALIGRQFIYLAVGGVVIFVLMSTQAGPLLIRLFLSMLIAAFSAAMALLRINDRGFDSLMLSYSRAMFGPTEWVWQKDQLSLQRLSAVTTQTPQQFRNSQQNTESSSRQQLEQLQQVFRYQSFLSQKETMDANEVQFIEQLNFSESIPQRAFELVESTKPAPPMLTKANYTTAHQAAKPDPVIIPIKRAEPITEIAGNPLQIHSIAVAGRPNISLRRNQTTNRSLSRHLFASGVYILPVRGERKMDISPELRNELTAIKNVAPQPVEPTTNLVGQPISSSATGTEPETVRRQSITMHNAIDYANDWSKNASLRQQLDALGQSLSGSTLPSQHQPANTQTENQTATVVQSQAAMPTVAHRDTVKVVKPRVNDAGEITPEVVQQLSQTELEAQQAIAELEKLQALQGQIASEENPGTPTDTQINGISSPIELTKDPAPLAQAESVPQSSQPAPVDTGADQDQLLSDVPPVIQQQTSAPSPVPAPQPPLAQAASSATVPTASQDLQDKMAAAGVASTPQQTSTTSPTQSNAVSLTNEPNIVSGRVLDSQGQSMPGVIVVVKNHQGEPKRALKTNKLGQFVVTTPLANGSYTVEVDKKGFSFDIMKVELAGAVVPPVEIRSK